MRRERFAVAGRLARGLLKVWMPLTVVLSPQGCASVRIIITNAACACARSRTAQVERLTACKGHSSSNGTRCAGAHPLGPPPRPRTAVARSFTRHVSVLCETVKWSNWRNSLLYTDMLQIVVWYLNVAGSGHLFFREYYWTADFRRTMSGKSQWSHKCWQVYATLHLKGCRYLLLHFPLS